MLELFSVLALLLASADRPQKGVEITAENGRVVVPSGDSCFRAERLTYRPQKAGKVEFEFRAEGSLIVVQVDGLRIQAAKMRYDPASGFLSCKGDAENKARLSIMRKGEWQLDKEGKTISYYVGGAVGVED